MSFCSSCGSSIEENTNFCSNCGNDLQKNNLSNTVIGIKEELEQIKGNEKESSEVMAGTVALTIGFFIMRYIFGPNPFPLFKNKGPAAQRFENVLQFLYNYSGYVLIPISILLIMDFVSKENRKQELTKKLQGEEKSG